MGGWLLVLLILLLPAAASAATRLPVSFHRQEHSLSCEVATLKMALAPHGITVSEAELIQKLPFETTPKSAGIWGDPNKGFVGNIDGRMLRTGYGVYWDPIAKLTSQYATATVIRHGSAQDIAHHLTQGNPVIIWGYFGPRTVYNWNTPAGTTVKAVGGEHTRVVYGFDGPVENPARFYLVDPLAGFLNWSTAELMHNWSALDHMAVVVAPPRQWVRVAGEADIWEIDTRARTRRLITTWQAFLERSAGSGKVNAIERSELSRYTRAADIQ